jgi:hypothetical protein
MFSNVVLLSRTGGLDIPFSISVTGDALAADIPATTHHDASAAAGGAGGVAKMKKIEPSAASTASTVKPT